MKLEGRKAIVTGGAQGIGLAIAKRLNAEGAKVALFDINEELVTKSASELDGCIGVRCDVSSPASIEEAIGKVAEAFGGIDIVVNNAGILPKSMIEDVTEKEWDLTMAINLKGAFFMFTRRAHGRI